MKRAWLVLTAGLGTACGNDGLSPELPIVRVTPVLAEGSGQTALADPVGIDCANVPLHGTALATFAVQNLDDTAVLEIKSARVTSAVSATLAVKSFPDRLKGKGKGFLVITFSPLADLVVGSGIVALETNAGQSGREVVEVQVRGTGMFVGVPNLEVCHGAQCHDPEPGECTAGLSGDTCVLPALDFGNVALSSTATQQVTLRDVPQSGTCLPPPGSASCTATCQLTFSRIEVTGGAFALIGSFPVPFAIDSNVQAGQEPNCNFSGELRLLLSFTAGTNPADAAGTLVIASNDPDAAVVEVPLRAAAAYAPVAVATLRPCDINDPAAPCSVAGDIQPLDQVYLDGTQSYDVDATGTPQPAAPLAYNWRLVDFPSGAGNFQEQGFTTALPSFWVPLAGTYTARLVVTNTGGLVSPPTDVTFEAVPASRLHLQLVWDNQLNDQDLHLTSLMHGNLVCDKDYDCHWNNCRLACLDPNALDCARPPPAWFDANGDTLVDDLDRVTGPNPRIDIDDRAGLGPENINIDAPQAALYHMYVHYYGLLDTTSTATRVTLRVYIDGQQRAEYRETLNKDEIWYAGDIDWRPNDTAVVTPTAPGSIKKLTGCTTGRVFTSLPNP